MPRPQEVGAGGLNGLCDFHNLIYGFYRTWPGNQSKMSAADFYSRDINDRILWMKGAVGKFIWL